MKYKAIFIDLDNTLLDSNHRISPVDKEAIRHAYESGVKVILCSGRSNASIVNFVNELNINSDNNYISAFNGCIICYGKNQKIISQYLIKRETALKIINDLRKFDISIIIYNQPEFTMIEAGKWSEYLERYHSICKMPYTLVKNFADVLKDEIPKIVALGSYWELEKINAYFDSSNNTANYEITTVFSSGNLLEFNNINASKGNSLIFIADRMGIKPSETVAIGDNQNDISMIEASGLGIAVANAIDSVKASADYITSRTNNDSAVAEVIYKYILT